MLRTHYSEANLQVQMAGNATCGSSAKDQFTIMPGVALVAPAASTTHSQRPLPLLLDHMVEGMGSGIEAQAPTNLYTSRNPSEQLWLNGHLNILSCKSNESGSLSPQLCAAEKPFMFPSSCHRNASHGVGFCPDISATQTRRAILKV